MDGWNVTVVNVSKSSITFQWPKLVLGNQVRAYVAIAETTDGKEIAGDIVYPNVTSITIGGLEGGTEYRLFAAVLDVLGQLYRSSELLMEGGKCEKLSKTKHVMQTNIPDGLLCSVYQKDIHTASLQEQYVWVIDQV